MRTQLPLFPAVAVAAAYAKPSSRLKDIIGTSGVGMGGRVRILLENIHAMIHFCIRQFTPLSFAMPNRYSPVHSHPILALERQIVGCYAIIISFQICTCYNNFWRTSGTECPLNRKKQCLHHGHVDSFVVHQTHLQFYVASS